MKGTPDLLQLSRLSHFASTYRFITSFGMLQQAHPSFLRPWQAKHTQGHCSRGYSPIQGCRINVKNASHSRAWTNGTLHAISKCSLLFPKLFEQKQQVDKSNCNWACPLSWEGWKYVETMLRGNDQIVSSVKIYLTCLWFLEKIGSLSFHPNRLKCILCPNSLGVFASLSS